MEAETLEILSWAVSGNTRPQPRHVNFDLIRTVNLDLVDFELMKVSLGEPDL